MFKTFCAFLAVGLCVALPAVARADPPAWAKTIAWQHDTVRLPGSGSTLVVPPGTAAALGPDALTVLKGLSDTTQPFDSSVEAVVVADSFADYVILSRYDTGYVPPDNWKSADPGVLYAALVPVVPPAAYGSGPVALQGWLEPPSFDRQSGTLRWAASFKAGDRALTDYKVIRLSRSGYEYITWATLADPTSANLADAVVSGFAFGPDQRYADHRSFDRTAGFGVAELAHAAAAGDAFPHETVAFGFGTIAVVVLGGIILAVLVQLFIGATRQTE